MITQMQTPDGRATVNLLRPDTAPRGGVILYMDAFGPRPALVQMAERIASWGLIVALPDLYYRLGPYGPFDPKTTFADPVKGAALRGMMTATTQAQTVADTGAVLDLLAENGVTGPVGAVGYCMGGARALNAAAAWPDRIAAAASFHGGNLASGAADSPHLAAGRISGRVYVGMAGIDQSFPPEQGALLAQALREAEVDHTLENYVGMKHGWAVPDHSVHDATGAARHWHRLQTLFSETLLG